MNNNNKEEPIYEYVPKKIKKQMYHLTLIEWAIHISILFLIFRLKGIVDINFLIILSPIILAAIPTLFLFLVVPFFKNHFSNNSKVEYSLYEGEKRRNSWWEKAQDKIIHYNTRRLIRSKISRQIKRKKMYKEYKEKLHERQVMLSKLIGKQNDDLY